MSVYDTTCVEWEDGWWGTEADSPAEAACAHAKEGWENDDTPSWERKPLTVRVRQRPDGDETRWTVTWEDGKAVAVEKK